MALHNRGRECSLQELYVYQKPKLWFQKPPTEFSVQETPKIKWAIVIALAFLPELEGETLLLKTPHTSHTGLGRTELERLPGDEFSWYGGCSESC